MEKHISKETIIEDLKSLGICEGDVLYIRGDMGKIGDPREIEGRLQSFFVDALLEVVGENGTVITASFTANVPFWKLTPNDIYTLETKSYCGTLARLFLKHEAHVRSRHPSNSCVAIGKYAHYLLDAHDENALAYSPLARVVELNGKIISFGCVESNCGFPTTHYVEEALGLTLKNFRKGLSVTYYYDRNGEKKKFKRKDPGGCAGRVYKLYNEYAKGGIFTIGSIGRAIAIKANIKEEFDFEYELIRNDPGIISCDNPNCIDCNFLTPRKKYVILNFFLYRAWIIAFKLVQSLCSAGDWKSVIRPRCDYKIDKDPLFTEEILKIKRRYGNPL